MIDTSMNILTIEGYFKRFYWYLQNGCNYHKEAYEKVEIELQKIGAPSRYSDYSSFRRNKSYHLGKMGRI